MTARSNQKGAIYISVVMILFFISALLIVSLLRSEAAFRLVKNRYWTGIVQDLAENGVAFEKMMIARGDSASGLHSRRLGKYAGYTGAFESESKLLDNGRFQVVSIGTLSNNGGDIQFSTIIIAEIHQTAGGALEVTGWVEKAK